MENHSPLQPPSPDPGSKGLSPHTLPVVRSSRLARALGFTVALLASLAGLLFALYQTTLPRFFFALLVGVFLGALLGIFTDAALSRLLSLREHLVVNQEGITLQARKPIIIHTSRPFDLLLWRGEGDHKERGGLVYLLLAQEDKQLKLIGELGREELSEEEEKFLEGAVRAPLLEMIDAGALPGTLSLPKEGAVREILHALSRPGLPRRARGLLPARPQSLVIDGARLVCGEDTLDLSRVREVFQEEDHLFLREDKTTWALSSKVFQKTSFPSRRGLPANLSLEIPDAITARLILDRLPS